MGRSAPAGSGGKTFTSYLNSAGRVEAIWFPFTQTPWLKVWTPTPVKPPESREVSGPYNYFFSDAIPEEVTTPLGMVACAVTFLDCEQGRTGSAAAVHRNRPQVRLVVLTTEVGYGTGVST